MIIKNETYTNAYILTESSTDQELQEILDKYKDLRCVICNKRTARNFKPNHTLGLTINNNIIDGGFFVNTLT